MLVRRPSFRRTARIHALAIVSLLAACSGDEPNPVAPTDRTPHRIEVVSGAAQEVPAGALSGPLRVRVVDEFGLPVVGTTVTFAGEVGVGRFEPVSVSTDGDGIAESRWRVPTAAGPRCASSSSARNSPAVSVMTAASGAGVRVAVTPGPPPCRCASRCRDRSRTCRFG